MIVPNSRAPSVDRHDSNRAKPRDFQKVVYYRDPILFLLTLGVFGKRQLGSKGLK
jgi:hypothetical protein